MLDILNVKRLPFLVTSHYLFSNDASLSLCFRQKRSMGLTLAEGELTKLDAERVRDRNAVEKERACAEQIIAKIEEVL